MGRTSKYRCTIVKWKNFSIWGIIIQRLSFCFNSPLEIQFWKVNFKPGQLGWTVRDLWKWVPQGPLWLKHGPQMVLLRAGWIFVWHPYIPGAVPRQGGTLNFFTSCYPKLGFGLTLFLFYLPLLLSVVLTLCFSLPPYPLYKWSSCVLW